MSMYTLPIFMSNEDIEREIDKLTTCVTVTHVLRTGEHLSLPDENVVARLNELQTEQNRRLTSSG